MKRARGKERTAKMFWKMQKCQEKGKYLLALCAIRGRFWSLNDRRNETKVLCTIHRALDVNDVLMISLDVVLLSDSQGRDVRSC